MSCDTRVHTPSTQHDTSAADVLLLALLVFAVVNIAVIETEDVVVIGLGFGEHELLFTVVPPA